MIEVQSRIRSGACATDAGQGSLEQFLAPQKRHFVIISEPRYCTLYPQGLARLHGAVRTLPTFALQLSRIPRIKHRESGDGR